MRLKISNFAKIKTADINLNGITVIAGDNNTGKTTVGKVLYSVFNSVYDIAHKIDVSRKNEMISRCRGITRESLLMAISQETVGRNTNKMREIDNAFREILNALTAGDMLHLGEEELENIFLASAEKYGLQLEEQAVHEFVSGVRREIDYVNQINDHHMAMELIERYFNEVFSGQFCNAGSEVPTDVKLELKGREIAFIFWQNECRMWDSDIEVLHEAFFLDDPFIVDRLNSRFIDERATGRQIISKILRTDVSDNVVDAILAKERLKEIYDILNHIVAGGIDDRNGQWSLKVENCADAICFDNLSAGLKSFVLLKLLLEKGILKEKDVLILDEPEIHLHPEWQIRYAEIIVLLQKKFDLTIVVTTHSRDFFEAIELYSKKYEVIDKCSFYLSKKECDGVVFEDVSEDTACIYKHLVEPSRLLDKIKFELEEGENE